MITPRLRSISPVEWAGLGIVVLVGACLRLWQPDLGYLSLHTTRDLYRSLQLLRGVEFPLLGSELQYGGRVLGPLMYVLTAIPLATSMNPVSVAIFIGVLNTLLLVVVWLFARAWFGAAVAFWATAFYAVFPLEIAQLRFNWNPCFLPLMATGALIGVVQVAVRRRPWHLLTVVLFISLGLQLHISSAELIVSAGIVLLVARVRIPWKVWAAAAALVLVLFSPLLIHELKTGGENLAQVVESPDTHRGSLERFSYNPNGLRNFFYHVRLQMHERGAALGFVYLEIMPLIGEKYLGKGWMTVAEGLNAFGQIQVVFWLIGVGVCVREARRNWRRRTEPAAEGETVTPHGRAALYLTLLAWQAVPIVFLSFFNYHGGPGEPPSLSPIRYYLVTYPAPFLTSALGIVGLAAWMRPANGRPGLPHLRRVTFAIGGLLLLSHVTFDVLYIQLLNRTGRMIPYQFPNLAPNMRSMLQVRDILLGEAKIDRDAYYERVHSQQLGDIWFGEATFDWLITQDPRSVTNPPPDPHLRWLLHSPYKESTEPKLPEGAEELRRWTLDGKGITIVEYRVEDPDRPAPGNTLMRNPYFDDTRMQYLGPEESLRRKSAEADKPADAPGPEESETGLAEKEVAS